MSVQQTVEYDEFSFPANRVEVTQEAVLAEDGLTVMGTRYVFRVSGVVSADTPALLAAKLCEMRKTLSRPQRLFIVREVPDGGSAVVLYNFSRLNDDVGGPTPEPLILRQFRGGLAASYEWGIVCQVKECFGSTCSIRTPTNSVLAMVRKHDFNVDMNGLTTRTISGTLTLSSRSVRANEPADVYRNIITPELPKYFKREAQGFTQSEDGRVLSYSFTDVEQAWTLPRPITKGGADFVIKIDGGLMATYILSGSFEAPPTVSKAKIVERIASLLRNRMPLWNQDFIMQDVEIREAVYENRIDFMFNGRVSSGLDPDKLSDFSAAMTTFGINPPDSDGRAQWVGPYGGDGDHTSGVVAPRPYDYDACDARFTGNEHPGSNAKPKPAPTSNTGERSPGTERIPTKPSNVSDEHRKAPYIAWHETISYELDTGIVSFTPKVKGAAPLFQQAREPTLHIIQSGYAKRYGKNNTQAPSPPPPIVSGRILRASVTPATPQPIGDGTHNEYTLHWQYVIQFEGALGETVAAVWPVDPRRPNAETRELVDMPALLEKR